MWVKQDLQGFGLELDGFRIRRRAEDRANMEQWRISDPDASTKMNRTNIFSTRTLVFSRSVLGPAQKQTTSTRDLTVAVKFNRMPDLTGILLSSPSSLIRERNGLLPVVQTVLIYHQVSPPLRGDNSKAESGRTKVQAEEAAAAAAARVSQRTATLVSLKSYMSLFSPRLGFEPEWPVSGIPLDETRRDEARRARE